MSINIPPYVEFVLNRLENKGFDAYIVGGSVRDILLNREPKDFDIGTNALPEDIEKVFQDVKTLDIGKNYGTITIVLKEGNVEVTTFRKEGKYLDGRRPEEVFFCSNIIDDLSRRDFTINAIAYNKFNGFVDPFEGITDLKNKKITTVGDPRERFAEDYLRLMRAVRFSCELDFVIDEETFEAGRECSKNICLVSIERVTQEFYKILLSKNPSKGIRIMEKMGLLEIVLPELIPTIGFEQYNPHHERDVYNHILCVLDNTPSILSVRLAALFHDIGKTHKMTIDKKGIGHFYGHDKLSVEIAEKILKRFRSSNELIEQVSILVKEHMTHHSNFSDKGLKRFIRRVGKENIFNLFMLQKADRRCSNLDASIESILKLEKRVKKIFEKEEAYEVRHLDVDGNDLIELGYEEGKIIGEILEYLLEIVVEEPSKNKKEILIEIALKKYPLNVNTTRKY